MNACIKWLSFCLWFAVGSSHAYAPEIGEVAGSIEVLEYVDGTPFDVSALRGKPLVLYFGADWCVPCIERGRPAVLQAAQKYGPMGLQTVFVSMDDNRFRQRKIDESATLGLKIAMPLLSICAPGKCLSGIKNLGNFGRLYAFPTAVVIDQFGVVSVKLMSGSGVRDGLDEAVKKVMQSSGLLPVSR